MKRNLRWIAISSLFVGAGVVSCGKGGIGNPFGSADPLDGLPEHIRNAKPGFEKPVDEGLSENEMPITSNQSYFLFYEGVSGEGVVQGRILRENYQTLLSIQNISDFPGASFDPATGTFRWTPALGLVPETKDLAERNLKVQLVAKSQDGREVVSKTRDFLVMIQKVGVQAAIVGHTLNAPFVREGSRLSFDLEVLYRGVPGQTREPDLRVLVDPPQNSFHYDLSKFVSRDGYRQSPSDPNRWIYTFDIDLREAELTKSSKNFRFKISFVNPQGVASTPQEFSVDVRTDLEAIVSTLERSTIEVNPGQILQKEVVFFDPGDEGDLAVQVVEPAPLPNGMSVDCREGASQSIQICTVNWTVAATETNRQAYNLKFNTVSKSPVWGDSYSVQDSFYMNFRVVVP